MHEMAARTQTPVVLWFRQDLRLGDNPALSAAAATGRPILPVYVLDDAGAGDWAMGGASRWWLHHSLSALDRALGGRLVLRAGRSEDVIPELARAVGASGVFLNACSEPWRAAQDASIETALKALGVRWHRAGAATLWAPDAVLKADGTPYRVFTPFYRKGCLATAPPPREPLPRPGSWSCHDIDDGSRLDALGLLPTVDWHGGLEHEWRPGEAGALQRLDEFLTRGIRGYREGRNRPDLRHVSRLSPHLHFGEISPNQVWHAVRPLLGDPELESDVDCFLSELGWREFSHYLLHHWPTLPHENLQPRFDRFPWQQDPELLARWQQGQTGYPIVDAGMRELWQTGYMHNRVRMIVGSFLVKNLLLHWHAGETWFWDTLVDADLASNSASWQWIAGSGADAAPYFRIFNPVTQGRKFDPGGDYVRRFVPELAALDAADIHSPWQAQSTVQRSLDYPGPIVDLAESRERALAAFRASAGDTGAAGR